MTIRRKVMIIPYTEDGRVLTVRDKRTGEWGFISGGVKAKEPMADGAKRELEEETSGLFTSIPSFHRRIEITTRYRPPELLSIDRARHENVKSVYYIYTFKVSNDNLPTFKPNNEVTELMFQYYDGLENTWEWCDHVFNKII